MKMRIVRTNSTVGSMKMRAEFAAETMVLAEQTPDQELNYSKHLVNCM